MFQSKKKILAELYEARRKNEEYEKTIAEFDGIFDLAAAKSHRFETILDCIPLPICTTDEHKNIVYVNKSMEETFQISKDDMIGKPCSSKKSPICGTDMCAFKRYVQGNSKTPFDMNGKSFEVSLSPLLGIDKEAVGYIEIIRERTAEAEIRKFQENEMNKLVHNLKLLAEGELSLDLSVCEGNKYTQSTRRSFETINNTIEEAVLAIKTYVSDASQKLSAIASEDFSAHIDIDYKGEFSLIKDSIDMIISNMNSIVHEIGHASDEILNGAEAVSKGSHQIAQATAEQAATVEEISTSIDTVANQAKENAENSRKASELARSAEGVTMDGVRTMDEMIGAMNDINEASNGISKIIKVIEDIAFQTNILALNAAVEAARAGQHGKGFAVVAAEVRNLAAKSAKAANETTSLIEGTIEKTTHGAIIARNASKAFGKIREVVTEASSVVNEISGASNDQALFIGEISQAIDQIAGATHMNSESADKSAMAGVHMSDKAKNLKERIYRFKTRPVERERK